MGLGDPDHMHPLRSEQFGTRHNCSKCELPINGACYACTDCSYFIHKLCADLPQTMTHPNHAEHPLTLLPVLPSDCSSSTICDDCQNPCLGFSYHCAICQFKLHLKCFLTLKHDIHQHPLSIYKLEPNEASKYRCRACAFPAEGFTFGCSSCEYYIHCECISLPSTVKHHHHHSLAFSCTFPKESDQEYCDVCEEEADRLLHYYYCKECDYIAHVYCVTRMSRLSEKEQENKMQLEHFSHEHPLIISSVIKDPKISCYACGLLIENCEYYYCNQCNNVVFHKSCAKLPSLLRHPRHEEHTLSLLAKAFHDNGTHIACFICGGEVSGFNYHCVMCGITLHLQCARSFEHVGNQQIESAPHTILLEAESPYPAGRFRCDHCGELGQGFNLHCTSYCMFDIHLECFSLPSSIGIGFHPHKLSLVSSQYVSGQYHCVICNKKADPAFCVYYCHQCKGIAHLKCAAPDLFSVRQTCNSQPNFCTVFTETPDLPEQEPICFSLPRTNGPRCRDVCPLLLWKSGWLELQTNETNDQHGSNLKMTDLTTKQIVDEGNGVVSMHKTLSKFQHFNCQHQLNLLDEKPNDEVFCLICKLLIFPPAYGCAQCRIFLHNSCTLLLHKYTSYYPEHTFTLVAPPHDINSSKCNSCARSISSFAYCCGTCSYILHAHCAFGVPHMKHHLHEHLLFYDQLLNPMCWKTSLDRCAACCERTELDLRYSCSSCQFFLHIDCAMLPYTVMHKIHRDPLALTSDLDPSDEFGFVCDVCEEEVDPQLWAYHCATCNQSAHVPCVITTKKRFFEFPADGHYTLGADSFPDDRTQKELLLMAQCRIKEEAK